LSNAMHLSSWLDKTIELPFDEELYNVLVLFFLRGCTLFVQLCQE